MKEIEVKAKVKDLKKLIKNLEKLGCELNNFFVQKDRIYLDKKILFPEIKRETNVLRIREQGNKNIFTLKKNLENELVCIEHETVFENTFELEKILKCLGYYEAVRVNKKRRRCKLKEYEICLDEVENLGTFIEIEKFSKEDSLKVQEELREFLFSLGIDKNDIVTQGYDTLMYNYLNKK